MHNLSTFILLLLLLLFICSFVCLIIYLFIFVLFSYAQRTLFAQNFPTRRVLGDNILKVIHMAEGPKDFFLLFCLLCSLSIVLLLFTK